MPTARGNATACARVGSVRIGSVLVLIGSISAGLTAVTLSGERVARSEELGIAGSFGEPAMSLTYRAIYSAYQVRLFTAQDPDGHSPDIFRNLNPLYQTLDVAGYNLGPGGGISVVTSLRYQTDLGTGFRRDTPVGAGIPAVDGRDQFNVLFAYVDWRDVVPGRLDVRLGRQLVMDDLAWYRLDGLAGTTHVFRTSSVTLDVEAYVGMPVRYDVLFSSTAMIADGFEVDDGPGLAFGGSVNGRFFRDLSASVAFREELKFRGHGIDVFRGAPSSGVAQMTAQQEAAAVRLASAGRTALEEQGVGGSLGYTLRPAHLDFFAHAQWNLIFGHADILRGGVAYNPERWLHAQVEAYQVRPMFAADSIFNIFNIFPYQRGRAELTLEILPGLLLEAGYFLLHVQGDVASTAALPMPSSYRGPSVAHGPSGGLSYRHGIYGVGMFAEASTNSNGEYAFGGNYRQFEGYGNIALLDNRLGGTLRVGSTTIQNDWFAPYESGQVQAPLTSYYVDVGARGAITDGVRLSGNFVKNFSSYLEGSYRVLTVLEVAY